MQVAVVPVVSYAISPVFLPLGPLDIGVGHTYESALEDRQLVGSHPVHPQCELHGTLVQVLRNTSLPLRQRSLGSSSSSSSSPSPSVGGALARLRPHGQDPAICLDNRVQVQLEAALNLNRPFHPHT